MQETPLLADYAHMFYDNRVDGTTLLQCIDMHILQESIGVTNKLHCITIQLAICSLLASSKLHPRWQQWSIHDVTRWLHENFPFGETCALAFLQQRVNGAMLPEIDRQMIKLRKGVPQKCWCVYVCVCASYCKTAGPPPATEGFYKFLNFDTSDAGDISLPGTYSPTLTIPWCKSAGKNSIR